MLPADLQRALERSGGAAPWSRCLVHRMEVTSTNDVAAQLAEHGADAWTTVVADRQTAGRGRMGRTWHSPERAGLYFSTVVRPAPDVASPAVQMLTMGAGVAVADGIRHATGLRVQLKWPNDVVAPDSRRGVRKLAGILAEAHGSSPVPAFVVIGCGINLRPASRPADLDGRVTSIEEELGRPADRGAVLESVLSALRETCDGLFTSGAAVVLDRWRELSPSAAGVPVRYQTPAGWIAGRSDGVEADGALRIRSRDGVACVRSGIVEWR